VKKKGEERIEEEELVGEGNHIHMDSFHHLFPGESFYLLEAVGAMPQQKLL